MKGEIELNNNYDFKPNSHAYKLQQNEENKDTDDKKKIEKVVSGNVKLKKKNSLKKLGEVFISEDAPRIKSYLLEDVIIPAFKDLIEDVGTNGLRMLLRGEVGARKSSHSGTRVSYGGFYKNKEIDRRQPVAEPRLRTAFDYDDILIENRGEAEAVLDQMEEVIGKYGFVSVFDLYDMVDITAPHTSNKYGWTDIRTAKVVPVRGGYVLKLPKPMPLD